MVNPFLWENRSPTQATAWDAVWLALVNPARTIMKKHEAVVTNGDHRCGALSA
jgi:hypothetical protein